ncbi:L,D-transpeptidase family protein [Methylobacterium oxalidis]|uniref:L,D-transpeptidase family protein n=1 Tax=Methylobacterium oxalidis TaxID=944322 RepID=UPI003315709F
MHVAKLLIASCMLATAGAGMASAQFVDPFKALEEARRDRLALDKRLAREAAERRQKEKADQAAKADTQRKLNEQRSAAVSALSPAASAEQPATSRTHQPASEAHNLPAASGSAASGEAESNAREALAAREPPAEAVLSPRRAEGIDDRAPAPNQIAALPTEVASPGTSLTPTPPSGATSDTPVQPQPTEAPARDVIAPIVAAPPRILITIDKAAQRMRVTVDGKLRHSWSVSTARAPFKTPAGTFRPLRLVKEHYSREWDDAPMPYSIFFTAAGHAIHASTATRQLGRPASHGCVRLAPSHAAALFRLVRAEGADTTKVTVTNGRSAERAVRSRAADARTRDRARHARRAPSDMWQVGFGDAWAE